MRKLLLLPVLCAATLVSSAGGAATREQVLTEMDQAATKFHTMTAKLTRAHFTAVISDTSTDSGTVYVRKDPSGEVQGLIEFTSPDVKTYAFENRKLDIYLPKIKTVQIFDLGKQGEELDQFLLIGLGTPGSELAKNYDVKLIGSPTVNVEGVAEKTNQLELVPKGGQAQKYVSKLTLWIAEGKGYAVQEQVFEPSGDYTKITYSNVALNPQIDPDRFTLKVPKGVKKTYPMKEK